MTDKTSFIISLIMSIMMVACICNNIYFICFGYDITVKTMAAVALILCSIALVMNIKVVFNYLK